ncbi:serine hydrolase domain-containing protein [Desulfogranum mediterraneum]|uniref:serine hydrolase domain-containing protein n=1 Tax=Desulfogranum mediterraneum TaxID=160661 RepID=UPI0004274AF3|nr:serine hydrolase domain-containing protein [Desulfogranum mediterraneum]
MAENKEKQLEKMVESLCREGVVQGVFPGCAVGISRKSGGSWQRFFFTAGTTRCEAGSPRISSRTLFDLASLSKPFSTVVSILQLIARERLDWQTPLQRCLPVAKGRGWEDIQIHHLLSHSSGLPAYHPFYRDYQPVYEREQGRSLLARILEQGLLAAPGTRNIYSDLGYILLGEIVAERSAMRLDRFFEELVSRPLGLEQGLCFRPLGLGGSSAAEGLQDSAIAATEACPWRGRILQGEVHDEHCWLLGGVAGHAGLFGDLEAVTALCEQMFEQWQGRLSLEALGGPLFRKLFTRPRALLSWYHGFDTPTPGQSSSGRWFSPSSAGHLGFSGTSFWMDPEKEVIVVLLSNRIHPCRENIGIRSFRPLLHDRIMECLGKAG